MTIMDASDVLTDYPSCSYPVSSLRDEPYLRPPADAPRYDPCYVLAPSPPRPPLDPVFRCYQSPVPQEVFPGVRADGVLTATHPLVSAFVAALPHTTPREGRKPPREAWWTKRVRGLAVGDVLELGAGLTDLQSECIFVLAALKLLYQFYHPAHFTLWGRESGPRTAKRVEKILYMSPSPIASPIGWAGLHEQLWFINGIQRSIFPTKNDVEEGETASNGMTLRKRKTRNDRDGERPKKRSKVADTDNKENSAAGTLETNSKNAHRAEAEDNTTETATPESGEDTTLDKVAKLELGIDDELGARTTPPLPAIERRSARQAHRRAATSASAASPTPEVAPIALPEAEAEATNALPARPIVTRARSSSSAVSGSGSSTAVSEVGSADIDTCVEEEEEGVQRKAKGKAHKSKEQTENELLEEEESKVRVSTRVRRLAPKKAEAVAQTQEENLLGVGGGGEEEVLPAPVVVKAARKRTASARSRARRA